MPTKISRRDLIVQVQGLTDCVEGGILPALEQGLQRDRELRAGVDAIEAFARMGFWQRVLWLVRGYKE